MSSNIKTSFRNNTTSPSNTRCRYPVEIRYGPNLPLRISLYGNLCQAESPALSGRLPTICYCRALLIRKLFNSTALVQYPRPSNPSITRAQPMTHTTHNRLFHHPFLFGRSFHFALISLRRSLLKTLASISSQPSRSGCDLQKLIYACFYSKLSPQSRIKKTNHVSF